MKGPTGLIVALILGCMGAGLNWFYLFQRSKDYKTVDFIGISRELSKGMAFSNANLQRIPIPKYQAEYLERSAYKWEVRSTVVGLSANRKHEKGEILLKQDIKTPPPKLPPIGGKYEGPDEPEDERHLWEYRAVPVDPQSFVYSFIVPGKDEVDFIYSPSLPRSPASDSAGFDEYGPDEDEGSVTRRPAPVRPGIISSEEIILGPFRVLALGNRLSSTAVMRAYGQSPKQEYLITISVKVKDGKFVGKAKELHELLQRAGRQQLGVLLHQSE